MRKTTKHLNQDSRCPAEAHMDIFRICQKLHRLRQFARCLLLPKVLWTTW
jgi:hypothetical protein